MNALKRLRDCLAIAGFALAADAMGATITIVNLPSTGTDLASGISTSVTYTHALDFGSDSSALSINSVPFLQVAPAGTSDTFTGGSIASSDLATPKNFLNIDGNNIGSQADGNMALLLDDTTLVLPLSSVGDYMQLTLTGLTIGQSYSTRIYLRGWDGGASETTRVIDFFADGESTSGNFTDSLVNVNSANGPGGASYFNYAFNANRTDVGLRFTTVTGGNGMHLYGVTNQVVPEPSTCLMTLAGLGALLGIRRRSRGAEQ